MGARLEDISEDVIYIPSFWMPGHYDAHTSEDVWKDTRGSVYAPMDFFGINPDIIGPVADTVTDQLVETGLLQDVGLDDLVTDEQRPRIRTIEELNTFSHWKELAARVGECAPPQMIGRAEMRAMVREAHPLGKSVIFDLIGM